MKEKTKNKLKSLWRGLTNPHLLISVGIAWFITNGWAYCFFGFGMYYDIQWMYRIGAFWMGMLWLPGTPEKLVTFVIAIWLLKVLFPDDTRTLSKITKKRREIMEETKLAFARFRAKFRRKKKNTPEDSLPADSPAADAPDQESPEALPDSSEPEQTPESEINE